ncbi:hypothetical protein NC651_000764 [Populus alba x Populus x berolinensis]|nr:hypothetical protein NC651_000758 [Populus alba x Populus x berolinensis]KAJ6945797.1 hypothetical protein NC651_000764 [Populus alba x Populus x berolinensis]
MEPVWGIRVLRSKSILSQLDLNSSSQKKSLTNSQVIHSRKLF